MASSIQKMSVLDSKQTTASNLHFRGAGVGCLSDISTKERDVFKTTSLTQQREHLVNEASEISSALFELDLGEDDEMLVRSEVRTPVLRKLEALLEHSTALEQQVTSDVQYLILRHTNRQSLRTSCSNASPEYDVKELAKDLKSLGYDVQIRQAIGGGSGGDGVANLSHSFFRCIPPNSERVFVLDPKFKEQFDIAHKTQSFEDIIAFLPELLILREDRIDPLVELLCEETAHSFKICGFPLPPWRKLESVLSKWHPRKALDTPVHTEAIVSSRINGISGASRFDQELPELVKITAW